MSLGKIQNVCKSLAGAEGLSLQLLKIKISKKTGISYTGREVIFSPDGALSNFVTEISEKYTSGLQDNYTGVQDYDGSVIGNVIYKISISNNLIKEDYNRLVNSLANPNTEIPPLEFGAQAYVIKGKIKLNDENKIVRLITMQKPVTVLQHKFLYSNSRFKEISDKVISLKTLIDIMIVDDMVYMFNLSGERLFNLERAYKKICSDKVNEIKECDFLTDFTLFEKDACSGHNPRRFISFNDSKLQALKNKEKRIAIAKKFEIIMTNGKIDTTVKGNNNKLVKLLCNNGMVDPFDETPKEVAGARKWS